MANFSASCSTGCSAGAGLGAVQACRCRAGAVQSAGCCVKQLLTETDMKKLYKRVRFVLLNGPAKVFL